VHKVLVEAGALASTRAVGANDVHGQATSQGMDAASKLELKISALNVTVCLESDRYVCMCVSPCMYICRSSWVGCVTGCGKGRWGAAGVRGGDVCGGRGDAHGGRGDTHTGVRGELGSWGDARSGASFGKGVMAPYLGDTRRDWSSLAECSSTRRPKGRLTPTCAGRFLLLPHVSGAAGLFSLHAVISHRAMCALSTSANPGTFCIADHKMFCMNVYVRLTRSALTSSKAALLSIESEPNVGHHHSGRRVAMRSLGAKSATGLASRGSGRCDAWWSSMSADEVAALAWARSRSGMLLLLHLVL
jgi:hypothetical protein